MPPSYIGNTSDFQSGEHEFESLWRYLFNNMLKDLINNYSDDGLFFIKIIEENPLTTKIQFRINNYGVRKTYETHRIATEKGYQDFLKQDFENTRKFIAGKIY